MLDQIPPLIFRWQEVEKESGIQVLFRTGGLQLAQKKMEYVAKNYADAMAKHKIPLVCKGQSTKICFRITDTF